MVDSRANSNNLDADLSIIERYKDFLTAMKNNGYVWIFFGYFKKKRNDCFEKSPSVNVLRCFFS